MKLFKLIALILFLLLQFGTVSQAQMITGVWRGKISGKTSWLSSSYKLELKLIQRGDSLTGTSYYYTTAGNYYRFKVKGYLDAKQGLVIWWDEEMLEFSTSNKLFTPNQDAWMSEAEFNCPGGDKMLLDGTAKKKKDDKPFTLHLEKVNQPSFKDEWDWLIDNYTAGANNPIIIDSIEKMSGRPAADNTALAAEKNEPAQPEKKSTASVLLPGLNKKKTINKEAAKEPDVVAKKEPVLALSIEEKYQKRQKQLVTEIPLTGDSIELRFYDNAEIDGDSISLFLNDKIIFQHIRLEASPYIIKLAVKDLKDQSELTMVAENLGSIPPNTSYMLAIVNEQRYEAMLTSTEQTSAVIRFRKTNPL
jgi:hypothetical protein